MYYYKGDFVRFTFKVVFSPPPGAHYRLVVKDDRGGLAFCIVNGEGKESVMPARPTSEQLREIAHVYGMHLSDTDLESFRGLMGATFESYRRIDQLSEPALPVRYARTGGSRPTAEENPLNAWYQQCSIKGAASGPLTGKRIAIKDNVCVAGVPMMNGSSVLEGYVPEFDA